MLTSSSSSSSMSLWMTSMSPLRGWVIFTDTSSRGRLLSSFATACIVRDSGRWSPCWPVYGRLGPAFLALVSFMAVFFWPSVLSNVSNDVLGGRLTNLSRPDETNEAETFTKYPTGKKVLRHGLIRSSVSVRCALSRPSGGPTTYPC